MDPLDRSRISSAFTTAMSAFVKEHSVGLALPDGGVGSGTCVRIGDRFFVATAAHLVKDIKPEQVRIIHGKEPQTSQVSIARIGARGGGEYDPVDTAYLEVSSNSAASIERSFLDLSYVEARPSALDRQWLFLFGFPAELRQGRDPEKERVEFRFIGYLTVAVTGERGAGRARPQDVVVEYSGSALAGPADYLLTMPHPGGVSGGSIWAVDPNGPSPILSARDARWIAIQHTFVPSTRTEYGNPMGDFLALLEADYADLRAAISGPARK